MYAQSTSNAQRPPHSPPPISPQPDSEVPRPCLRSLRFLRPKIRTLEKMSTRFPLQSPLFLLGLFLRRLVEGRSKCCSRACLFCLISPLAIAAAMAQNVTTAQVQSAHRAQTTQTAASRASCHSPMVAAERSAMANLDIRASVLERRLCFPVRPSATW